MARKPPSKASVAIVGALLAGFIIWSVLTLDGNLIDRLDQKVLHQPPSIDSALGQIATSLAMVTWPGVMYAVVLAVAFWAARHRLRQLAFSLLLSVVIGWVVGFAIKLVIAKPRPAQALDVITATGYSYPSGHMVAAAVMVVGVGATFAVTRQSERAKALWQLASLAILAIIGLDRWLTASHYLSDLVGGVLLGAFAGSVSLLIAGVSVLPYSMIQSVIQQRHLEELPPGTDRLRCAVVYNPSKVLDWVTFRRRVEYELTSRGWARAMWLETTPDDPGHAMTARAVAEKVDLVLGAGGDGTIRVVCSGLAGTGIPFGLIPAGTGNLLARNLGIPLDEAEALDVAFDGVARPIDLVKVTTDDGRSDHFAVMAGIGLDAVIMEGTNADLKKAVGSAAYFVSAAQNANHPPLHATVQIDDEPPIKRRASVIVVGNVGYLQANIPLIPDARADDGLLDVIVASPRGVGDWIKLTAKVLTRRKGEADQLDRLTGRKVTITVEERDQYQLDGDTVGECSTMIAEVQPGALLLRLPS